MCTCTRLRRFYERCPSPMTAPKRQRICGVWLYKARCCILWSACGDTMDGIMRSCPLASPAVTVLTLECPREDEWCTGYLPVSWLGRC